MEIFIYNICECDCVCEKKKEERGGGRNIE